MFVDGAWGGAASGGVFTAESPATGEAIGEVPQGSREDAQRAIAAANRAAEGWARLTAFERAAKMHAVADAIEARRDELAQMLTLDQGKPLRAEAHDEVTWPPRTRSGSRDDSRTRSRRGSASCSCAVRAVSSA